MRYEGKIYRPPSEGDALILQATIGCSWNHCTYCDMYRDKAYRVRDLDACLEDLRGARARLGPRVRKLFVADGDALGMPDAHWSAVLDAARDLFPHLSRVSCYATARNLLERDVDALRALRERGLSRVYIGPESGDDVTLKAIAKGATAAEHVEAAARARAAGMDQSVIFLLGAGGVERSEAHARASAELASAMDPAFLAALTLTVVPGTPIHTLEARGRFTLPDQPTLLRELRTFVAEARPTNALFRTNHASNYLPIRGRLPADGPQMVEIIDLALEGRLPLRPEWSRGL